MPRQICNSMAVFAVTVCSVFTINEQETRNLILQIQSGDAEAETRLVELHKGFTASVARQYQGQGLTDEEITSACESALKRAAHKFDLNKDFAFISYAIW